MNPLSGANTYVGNTTINSGNLTIGESGLLGSGTYAGNIDNSGTLTYKSSAAQILSGVISGEGAVTQTGSGTLTLSGKNKYNGGTIINSGTLQISGDGTLGSMFGSLTVKDATLDLGNTSQTVRAVKFSSGIITNGSLTGFIYDCESGTVNANLTGTTMNKSGFDELKLTGLNTFAGDVAIKEGTLTLGVDEDTPLTLGRIDSLSISIEGGATFDVSAISEYSLSMTLSASGAGTGPTAATIKGAFGDTIKLSSQLISLTFSPTSFHGDINHPSLYISQGVLSLKGNVFNVINNSGEPLGAGTYRLVEQGSGSIKYSGSFTVNVGGTGIVEGATDYIQIIGGYVNLVVLEPELPTPNFSLLPNMQNLIIPKSTLPITLSGNANALDPIGHIIYPAVGEIMSLVINGNLQTTTINDSTSDFSFSYNLSAIPASAMPYIITYSYGGDSLLNPATDTSTTLTVIVYVPGDFNGDGKPDLLWESTNGQHTVWYQDGITNIGWDYLPQKKPDPAWRIVRIGDLNGDGKSDLVWESSDGQHTVWYQDGIKNIGWDYLHEGKLDSGWTIVGILDFNGDGKPDLIWESIDGDHTVWFQDGIKNIGWAYLHPGIKYPGWSIVGIGDFNGDGKPDLVWESIDGDHTVWFQDGLKNIGWAYLHPGKKYPGWSIVGIGDFNGDGKPDLVWESIDGDHTVWFQDGLKNIGWAYLHPGKKYPGWRIVRF